MSPIALHLFLASICLGGTFASSAHGQQPSAQQYVVVAIADDTQSVVIRDPSGIPHLFRKGDKLPEGHWQLVSVRSDAATFRAAERVLGNPVDLQLRAGQVFDPQTLSQSLQREIEPVYGAERMVPRKPVASSSKTD